jgi:hypothetical protein
MIGDHHGRRGDTATLLFTATDGILGTQRSGWPGRTGRRPMAHAALVNEVLFGFLVS